MNANELTCEQKKMAIEHHNLVYSFLHSKKLDVDTYYDIVVMGYLRGIIKYDTREDLEKYCFSTIAWRSMTTDLYNHYRYLNRKKRKANVISLDDPFYQFEDFPPKNMITSIANVEESAEDRLLWLKLHQILSEEQFSVTKMLTLGFSKKQTGQLLNLPYNELCAILDCIRKIIFSEMGIGSLSQKTNTAA